MSLVTIGLVALGYVIVLVVVLALLRTAKRADEAAERLYEAQARSLNEEAQVEEAQVVPLEGRDPDHEGSHHRRAG